MLRTLSIFYFLLVFIMPLSGQLEWRKSDFPNQFGVVRIMHDQAKVYAGSRINGLFVSSDGGQTWRIDSAGILPGYIAGLAANRHYIFASEGTRIYRKQRNAVQWQLVYNQSIRRVINDLAANDSVIVAGRDNGLVISFDQGNHWQEVTEFRDIIYSVEASNQVVLAGNNDRLYRSADHGHTWQTVLPGHQRLSTDIRIFGDTVFLGSGGNGLYRSLDLGLHWQPIFNDGNIITLDKADDRLFYMSNLEFFVYFNQARFSLPITLPDKVEFRTISINNNIFVGGTNDQGLYTAIIPPSIPLPPTDTLEFQRLKQLYFALNGDQWKDTTGWSIIRNNDFPPTGFVMNIARGVQIQDNGRIKSLSLESNNLTGQIPDGVLAFEEIETINLAVNTITGSISLGHCPQLTLGHFGSNLVTSFDFMSLANCPKLGTIYGYGNKISDTLPDPLPVQTSLETFDFSNNLISGFLSRGLINFSKLKNLFLFNNQLTGRIPADYGQLSNLILLGLSQNQLTGSIPAELAGLQNLKFLGVDQNKLSGCYPAELRQLCGKLDLTYFQIDPGNSFSAPWSSFCAQGLGQCKEINLDDYTALRALYLSTNGDAWMNHTNWDISTVPPALPPTDISGWYGVTLDEFSGRIIKLDLANNNLDGKLPPELKLLTHLQSLVLKNNKIVDSLDNLYGLNGLNYLDISYNQFEGEFNISSEYWSGMTHLDLSHNRLSGELPLGTFNSQVLSLNLSSNLLTGTVPNYLLNSNIQILNLSNNRFDKLEVNALNNGYLRDLNLSYNVLSGQLPALAYSLQSLDLSHNQYSGEIDGIYGFISYLDLSYNNFGGTLPVVMINNSNNTSLNLSHNSFTGSLPKSLIRSWIGLDLSYNLLSGCIDFDFRSWCGNPNIIIDEGNNFNVSFETFCTNDTAFCSFYNLDDYTALRAIYFATQGDLWTNQYGWEFSIDTPPPIFDYSHWGGITVNQETKRVIGLILATNNLTGTIPSEIGLMKELSFLDLSHNNLTGPLPGSIINCENLSTLIITNNHISGILPDSLLTIKNLTSLAMNNNIIEGTLPSVINVNSMLSSISIANNKLIGTIPGSFLSLPNLISLDLSNNILEGPLPSEYASNNIQYLNFSNNKFSGPFPRGFENQASLTHLYLNENELSGSLPSSDMLPPYLGSLILHTNKFTGTIKSELFKPNLINVDLSRNMLTGVLPDLTPNSFYWPNINFSNNVLTGSIPKSWGEIGFRSLDLSNNQITGKILLFTSSYSPTTSLNLSFNRFEDTIPAAVFSLQDLVYLNLSHNNLRGSIPHSLTPLNQLDSLFINNNQLTGIIPLSFAYYVGLDYINLENNQFSNCIPFYLKIWCHQGTNVKMDVGNNFAASWSEFCLDNKGACSNINMNDYVALRSLYLSTNGHLWNNNSGWDVSAQPPLLPNIIDLSGWYGVEIDGISGRVVKLMLPENNLVGRVTEEIGLLTRVLEIDLSGNKLSGIIPPGIAKLSNLQILNISKNQLSGKIPKTFPSLTSLQYCDLNNNRLSGIVPDPTQIPNLIKLDLSRNNFNYFLALKGNISYLQYLDVSNNKLLRAPVNYAPCISLNYLDLSDNQIYGPVTGLYLNSSISFLDLSTNQYSGKLPENIGNIYFINHVDLSHNRFIGEIPAYWSNYYMTRLNLAYNRLGSNFSIRVNYSIQDLDISHNRFTSISDELAYSNMVRLDLSHNKFSGTLPRIWVGNVNLRAVDFSNNGFAGPIPAEYNNLDLMEGGDFSNNNLSGCFDPGLKSWCDKNYNLLISQGNEFEASWESFCTSGDGTCPQINFDDYVALRQLYLATQGDTWLRKDNWDISAIPPAIPKVLDFSNWYGVEIDANTKRVVKIDLGNNNLQGTMPEELSLMKELRRLNLSNNKLIGSIKLKNLELFDSLSLQNNLFDSHNIIDFVNLPALNYLNLQGNLLETIPLGITQSYFLSHINISYNKLQGTIPMELGLSNIYSVDLSNNMLSGSIPNALISGYRINVDLSHNQLNGSLRFNFSSRFDTLDLSYNQLEGPLTDLALIYRIIKLDLSHNKFTGPLPVFWATSIEDINLEYNQISGSLYPGLMNVSNLKTLKLAHNKLSGPLSPLNFEFLSSIDLSDNGFTELPYFPGTLPALTTFNLTNNNIDGCFPVNWSKLCKDNVAINIDTGNLFKSRWSEFCELGTGQCRNANLNDYIALKALFDSTDGKNWSSSMNWDVKYHPDSLPNELNLNEWFGVTLDSFTGRLSRLMLPGVRMKGYIPDQFFLADSIKVIDFSGNELIGEVLTKVFKLGNLEELRISNNRFIGNIPDNLSPYNKLRRLHLDHNQFFGSLPNSFTLLNRLAYLDLRSNEFSGILPVRFGDLNSLFEVRLDYNQFSGDYPLSFGNNSAPLRVLTLSHNNFSNVLGPDALNFIFLEEVDLSFNDFEGVFPFIHVLPNLKYGNFSYNRFRSLNSIVALYRSLEYLNLSHNQLEEVIWYDINRSTSLKYLDMSYNRLKEIQTLEVPQTVEKLVMSNNLLTGPLFNGLAGRPNLKYLDLAYNQFSDSIPAFFGELQLDTLLLNSNLLSGCYFPELLNLCTKLDSANIDEGNQFQASWQQFCTDSSGICPGTVGTALNANTTELPDKIVDQLDLVVFPNPVVEHVTFKFSISRPEMVVLVLFNSKGQKYQELKLSGAKGYNEIEVKDLSSGVNFYQLLLGKEIKRGKVVKLE